MIKFNKLSNERPYLVLKQKYDDAKNVNQKNIEAIVISSYSNKSNEVNSRFVNLKLLDNKDFIFFSNYKSAKSQEFIEHNQITALIYWNSINIQIRLKAKIKKTSRNFNNEYFKNRSEEKNALAISSRQSQIIDSYDSVKNNYNQSLKLDDLSECPDYWGGYVFTPYYFEFWEGHESRLNKRNIYEYNKGNWDHYILQP